MPAPKLRTRESPKYIVATAQSSKYAFAKPSTPTSIPPPCTICTRLSTIFPCCLTLKSSSPCPTCLAFDAAFAAKAPDAETTRQIQQDRVESLKLTTKDLEAEKDYLKTGLEEKRKIMQQKVKQLDGMVPRNDFKKRMKKVRKAGEARKLPGEK
ncbi:hypothetical protein HBH56_108810 [Parastagonospora nodorum]|uniref:Uncharacterized protein n=2 Tax=Phaeosphaeria nodorum (strain SN15 / ATCC MYA-4574 / FGSC 10173) TaxID=321614 RepID=A0A7U2FDF4_PHANO|nr:hypothetical protein SNOG_09996 [Parastagonospora nodorum SN15]KAH3912888.1 hypothetical protein HBH56_108810 [Parastagonospora nodorum]EAT82331.1 hypothetical protein SNOG_09996 [Parastagonospora nodorum SN15]KAH3922272.1 hypothetical protein HBH54_225910 [Parastagonospora nodorum]KAH3979331.1 hypothetical protein HBH52_101700 [Parastagonospora nodorum]KAH4035023.1 hypothetical protein HBI09_094210 [Parastagonospora nodorum]